MFMPRRVAGIALALAVYTAIPAFLVLIGTIANRFIHVGVGLADIKTVTFLQAIRGSIAILLPGLVFLGYLHFRKRPSLWECLLPGIAMGVTSRFLLDYFFENGLQLEKAGFDTICGLLSWAAAWLYWRRSAINDLEEEYERLEPT